MAQRGRPRLDRSPAKTYVVEAASQLFHKEGFHTVSVTKICERAGVSKMTFYRHFTDKLAIALHIVQDFYTRELAWGQELLRKKLTFPEKLDRLLERRIANHATLGMQFVSEFAAVEHRATNMALASFAEQVAELNLSFHQQGVRQGEISAAVTPEVFLYLLKKRGELMADDELAGLCPDRQQRFEVINAFFYFGIKGRRAL